MPTSTLPVIPPKWARRAPEALVSAAWNVKPSIWPISPRSSQVMSRGSTGARKPSASTAVTASSTACPGSRDKEYGVTSKPTGGPMTRTGCSARCRQPCDNTARTRLRGPEKARPSNVPNVGLHAPTTASPVPATDCRSADRRS